MARPPTGSGSAAQDVQGRGVEVVALVTSAGGLDALSTVLRALPRDFPAAVVLTQHLGGQGSALVEILAHRIALPVRWARQGGLIEPGTVTACPPRAVLEVLPDRTCAMRPGQSVMADRPLDALLTSVGDSFGAAALAVVLTGMGRDGVAGAAAVRAAGGRVIVQSADTAEQPSMPAAAVAADAVDLVLPLHEIGAMLVDVVAGRPLPLPDHEAEAIRRTFGEEGEVARLARGIDWAGTPLGAVSEWPEAQRAVVRLAMDSPNGVTLFLGPDHILLINEAAIEPVGGRDAHARVFAQPYVEMYPETVEDMLPLLARVFAGERVRLEAAYVPFARRGRLEDVWWDFNFTPIRSADGAVLGVYQAWLDRTDEVLARRRLQTLNRLAVAPIAGSRREALEAAISVLATAEDVPFAAAYLLDPARVQASLVAVSGAESGSAMAPQRLRLAAGAAWPLHRVVEQGLEVLLEDVAERFRGQRVSDERLSLEHAVLHPLRDQGADGGVVGIVLLGVLPTVPLDDGYRGFLSLVGETVGAKVHEAHARQRERDRLQRLADLDRAKTEFFSNVSHEFRTPLTLMLGPLEELGRDDRGLTPEQRADLELIRRNARRLLRLVGTMLDFSQIEAGRLKAAFAPVDLAQRTRDIVAQFDSAARRAGVGLEVDLEQLPEPVWVDVAMWEKIVSNLLSNALKFTFDGEVAVTLRALPKHAELVVRDTGVGIPEEELPHVFKRFHRVRGTRARTQEGAGIGLALVDELVRRHQGRIRAASTVGEGTTLTVWIPLGRRPTMPDAPQQEPAQATAVAAAIAEEAMQWGQSPEAPSLADDDSALHQSLRSFAPGAQVLVADDNKDMRDYLKRLLGPQWQVETAVDGTEALARARRKRPDLIVADVMMPGLDGFALLRELRDDPSLKSIPVVLVTARAGEEAAIEGLLAGADDYIVKPFSARELVARVGGQLEFARARKGASEMNEFLVRFSDTARGLSEPGAVAETACRMLIERLQAHRASWAAIDHERKEYVADVVLLADGTRAEPSRWPFDPSEKYAAEHLAGRSVVFTDSATDPRIPDATKSEMAQRGMRAGIATPVVLDGELRAVVSVSDDNPRLWTAEERVLVEALAGRAWAEVQRARAELALRGSEERYRTVFESMDEGFLIHEMVRNEAGRVVDYRLLEANPAHQRATGLPRETIGKLGSEFMPHVEQHWLDLFHRVSTSGVAERAEMYNEPTSRWYNVQVSPVRGHDRIAIVFDDVTDRRQAEMAVKASDERQAFLLRFSDSLRAEPDADQVAECAIRLLFAQMRLDRCYVVTYVLEDDRAYVTHQVGNDSVPPLPHELVLSDYPEALEVVRERTFIVEDDFERQGLSQDERRNSSALGMRAMVASTARKGKGTPLWSMAAISSQPRRWTPDEITLVEEATERTWAAVERARADEAVRESEARYRTLYESMDQGYAEIELIRDAEGRATDLRYLQLNPAYERLTGIHVADAQGRTVREVVPGLDDWWIEAYDRVARAGRAERIEYELAALGRWYEAHVYPHDSDRLAVFHEDITERKRAERTLHDTAERQAFLLRMSDGLRPLGDPAAVRTTAARLLGEQLGANRCLYAEIDGDEWLIEDAFERGVPPLPPGRYDIAQFGQWIIDSHRAGELHVFNDLNADERFDRAQRDAHAALWIYAGIAVPLVKDGTLVAVLTVQSAAPHQWTESEISLVEETAERTWAAVERARSERALRQREH